MAIDRCLGLAWRGFHTRHRAYSRCRLVGSTRQDFVSLAEDACAKLAKRELISANEIVAWPLFDDLRIYPRGATEVFTAPVIELGRAVIALVSGTLPEPPKRKAWLYGTEDGRETLEIT